MALPPMGPMSPPSPTLGGPQPNMGPPPMPPMPQMGGGMAPPMAPPPMGPQMGPPPINPVNTTAGNGQSFGGDAGGRKTFSQYLQSMNTSFPPTPTMPDPMAGGIGGGAPSMPPLAMMGGGAVPRSTMIGREPHRLAYINPGEEMMLRASGGTGEPGPGGVPAFRGGGFSGGGFGGFEGPGGYGGYDGGFGEAGRGGKDSDAPGRGPGDFGGGMSEGPGGVDIGLLNALADQKAAEKVAAIAESNEIMSPLGGADAIAKQNLVDSFMDTKDGRDLATFNDSFADIPSLDVTPADPNFFDIVGDTGISSRLGSPIDPVVGLGTTVDPNLNYSLPVASSVPVSNIATDDVDVDVNTLDEAFKSQYSNPNLSVSIPSTNLNMPDVSSLLGGVVRPDMMPPGYQPTPDDPTFEGLTSNAPSMSMNMGRIDPNLGAPMAPDYGDLNIDMGTDNLGGVGVGAEDPTFGYNIDMESDPFTGESAFTGLNAQTPTGMQDPSGASDITQISEAMQNSVTEAPNVNEIANIQAADVYGLPNTGLDTSLSAAQFADNLNPQGPTFTPTTLGLDEAARGQALADRVSLENREAALGDMNTPVQGTTLSDDVIASNQAALDNLDLSTKGLGPDPFDNEFRKDLSYAQIDKLIDEKLSLQAEIDANKGKFNLLSLVPGANLLGTSAGRRQKAINQVLSNDGGSGILNTGIGGATGVLGTGAVNFNPVYDKDGNFVGSQGVSKSGETVSYMGDMQGDKGYFDSDGNNVEMSESIEGYQEDIGGQGSPEGLDEPYNPCQPGFELDPNTNTCVPIDVVGGGGGSSGPIDLNPIIRPTTPVVTPDPVPPTPVVSPVLRMPKQFNMGGATSGSNLDGAIGRLLSSMS